MKDRPSFFQQVVMGWHHEGEEDGLDMERGRQNPSRCDHSYPALVNTTETGSHYARCLVCLTVGPERSSSVAACEALKDLGCAQRERNVYRAVVMHTI